MGKKTQKTSTNQTQTQNSASNSAFSNSSNSAFNNTSANTFGWQNMSDTEDIKSLRGFTPQIDPGLGYQYANAKNRHRNSFINPLGGYQTAQMTDALQRSGERQLNQDQAQAFRGGQYDVNNQRLGQLGTLASLTAPRLTQTGSTNSGTSTDTSSGTASGTSSGTGTNVGNSNTIQSGDLLGQILGAGAMVGSSALTGKNRG